MGQMYLWPQPPWSLAMCKWMRAQISGMVGCFVVISIPLKLVSFQSSGWLIGHLADDYPLVVGQYVTVGHGAVIHACEIGDECLIGMNSTVLDGAKIGKQSIVAAGSLVPAGMEVPAGSLVAGVPAKIKKQLAEEERGGLKKWAVKYLAVAKAHREKLGKMRPGPPA